MCKTQLDGMPKLSCACAVQSKGNLGFSFPESVGLLNLDLGSEEEIKKICEILKTLSTLAENLFLRGMYYV